MCPRLGTPDSFSALELDRKQHAVSQEGILMTPTCPTGPCFPACRAFVDLSPSTPSPGVFFNSVLGRVGRLVSVLRSVPRRGRLRTLTSSNEATSLKQSGPLGHDRVQTGQIFRSANERERERRARERARERTVSQIGESTERTQDSPERGEVKRNRCGPSQTVDVPEHYRVCLFEEDEYRYQLMSKVSGSENKVLSCQFSITELQGDMFSSPPAS